MKRFVYLLCAFIFIGLSGCGFDDKPTEGFLESKLIVRPGVDDLGDVKVRDFVSDLFQVQKPDGNPTELIGWKKTDAGYILRVKIASEFDLRFLWSKAEQITLLNEVKVDRGIIKGLEFYMAMSNMPKSSTSSSSSGTAANSTPTAANGKDVEVDAAPKGPASVDSQAASPTTQPSKSTRMVSQVTLQAFQCNDYCHLQYVDASGHAFSAICSDTKDCGDWRDDAKRFTPYIGAKADLVLGEKFVAEGNSMVDNIVSLSVTPVPPKSAVAAVEPLHKVANLCAASESPVFACTTGKKRASVCAVRTDGVDRLMYRLAPIEGAAEMEYPNSQASAAAAFKQGAHTDATGRSIRFLSFDKGEYRYVIYAGEESPKGVLVERGGKRLADLRCQGESLSSFDAASWQRMGLAQDSRALTLQ